MKLTRREKQVSLYFRQVFRKLKRYEQKVQNPLSKYCPNPELYKHRTWYQNWLRRKIRREIIEEKMFRQNKNDRKQEPFLSFVMNREKK